MESIDTSTDKDTEKLSFLGTEQIFSIGAENRRVSVKWREKWSHHVRGYRQGEKEDKEERKLVRMDLTRVMRGDFTHLYCLREEMMTGMKRKNGHLTQRVGYWNTKREGEAETSKKVILGGAKETHILLEQRGNHKE